MPDKTPDRDVPKSPFPEPGSPGDPGRDRPEPRQPAGPAEEVDPIGNDVERD